MSMRLPDFTFLDLLNKMAVCRAVHQVMGQFEICLYERSETTKTYQNKVKSRSGNCLGAQSTSR